MSASPVSASGFLGLGRLAAGPEGEVRVAEALASGLTIERGNSQSPSDQSETPH